MSATATPPISVVMSTFNSGPYLAPAIESILGQTWRDFEFIIVDDGSTDGTRERVAAYATRDPRICALPNEGNRGVPYTKGRLHTLARAPWIAQMDHDDVSRPERLARLLAAARAAPQAVFISSLRDILEPDGRIQPGPRGVCFERDLLAWFNMFYNRIGPDAALMYRASALREIGGYDPACRYAEDRDVMRRLLRLGPCVIVRRALYLWRRTPGSMTSRVNTLHSPDGVRMTTEEIALGCGATLTTEETIRLRDFWFRSSDPATTDWPAVQRQLLHLAAAFRPPAGARCTLARRRRSIALVWLMHAARALARHDLRLARQHGGRAREAAGAGWPLTVLRFAFECACVRGKVHRLA